MLPLDHADDATGGERSEARGQTGGGELAPTTKPSAQFADVGQPIRMIATRLLVVIKTIAQTVSFAHSPTQAWIA
jgi:hypothetical protein